MFGNFILSLCLFRASIFLHVKAPDNGGATLSGELRLDGEAARRMGDLRVPLCQRCERSRGSFGFLRPCQVGLRAGGNKVQRPSGRRPGSRRVPSGPAVDRGMRPLLGRGRSGLFGGLPSGAGGRVALQIPAFGGEVSVELRPHLSDRSGTPSFGLGCRPIRDRAGSARKPRTGSQRAATPPARAARGLGRRRASDVLPGPCRDGRRAAAALRPDGILRDPSRGSRERPLRPHAGPERARGRLGVSCRKAAEGRWAPTRRVRSPRGGQRSRCAVSVTPGPVSAREC